MRTINFDYAINNYAELLYYKNPEIETKGLIVFPVYSCAPAPYSTVMRDIRPLARDDRQLIHGYFRRCPPEISEHTFTNLFVWRHSRPILLAETGDSLVFLTKTVGEKLIVFGPPAGPLTLSGAADFLGDLYGGAIRIPEKQAADLVKIGAPPIEDRDNADYVYQITDLAELAGRRYAKKRNRIKQCLKNHACEYEEITGSLIEECGAMQDIWCRDRQCAHDPGLCREFMAIKEALANFVDFGLIGGAVRVDGEIKAYAIGEWLNSTTLVWHFEKAMPEVTGLGQLINQWFTRYGLNDFEFVNREQDLGIPGLRQAKKSYFPHHLVTKYQALPENIQLPPSTARGMCI